MAVTHSTVLQGLTIYLSSGLSAHGLAKTVKEHGGAINFTISKKVSTLIYFLFLKTNQVTHWVIGNNELTDLDLNDPKYKQAVTYGVKIVSERFLTE